MKDREYIINSVISSNKYSSIDKVLVERIVDDEIVKYKDNKTCIKSIKNRLHQIHGVYMLSTINKVNALLDNDDIIGILSLHSSTKERLLFYSEFYKYIFSITGIPNTIIDLACGYNPISIKYMDSSITYYAYDINSEVTSFLNRFFDKYGYNGKAYTCDLISNVPSNKADVAFLFKFMPLISLQSKLSWLDILNKIQSKYIVVTFPTKSLSGRVVGMKNKYSNEFELQISNYYKVIDKKEFSNELVYIIATMN